MKEIRSFDDFEKALKASKAPYIAPETIKTGVQKYVQSHKSKNLSRKLIPILIAVAVLSIGTAAFGGTLSNILFNKQGEKVYEYGIPTNIPPDEKQSDSGAVLVKYMTLMDKLEEDAKPGEQTNLIITSEYEKSKASYPIQSRKPIYNVDEIKKSTSTKFKTPVSNDIKFNEGIITFWPFSNTKQEAFFKTLDDKYKEARDKGLDYIVWTEPLSSEAESIELKYTLYKYYEDGKYNSVCSPFSLTISRVNAVSGGGISPENASKIKIGDGEGLFIDLAEPEIIYVDTSREKPLTYHFFFKGSDLKDTIVSLIENMQ